MNSFIKYHQSYLEAYKKNSVKKIKSTNAKKSNLTILLYLFTFPFLFTICVEFLFSGKSRNTSELPLISNINNFSYSYTDRIIDLVTQRYNDNKSISKYDYLLKEDDISELSSYKSKNIFKKHIDPYRIKIKNKPIKPNLSIQEIEFAENINEKKKKFINTILPSIIDHNREILVERERITKIKNFLILHKTLLNDDQKFIEKLAHTYSINTENRHKIDVIDELLLAVDIIPNSIALAQAANESGWGTSRFAKEYNAYFGEYTYNQKIGVIPAEREEGKKHLIKYFSSIDKSIESYFMNINSHYAYSDFRKFRKLLRDQNSSLDVNLLIRKLDDYAEDHKYVETIRSIINVNKLKIYDRITLISRDS